MIKSDQPILVTGSGGKLGRVLRQVLPNLTAGRAQPIWHSRRGLGGGDVVWNIGTGDPYVGPSLSGGVILHLAGGRSDLEANVSLGLAVCDLALEAGVGHVFLASSSAVYAPDPSADLGEDTPCAPTNDYGRAKARMEAEVAAWARARGNAAPGITFLRIGNVFGFDSLIGGAIPGERRRLTPVPGRSGGPMRSYIGPYSFADALAQLCKQALAGAALPRVLNIGVAPPVCMADLLDAAGIDWEYGEAGSDLIPRLVLSVKLMGTLIRLSETAALPEVMAAEWRTLGGGAHP